MDAIKVCLAQRSSMLSNPGKIDMYQKISGCWKPYNPFNGCYCKSSIFNDCFLPHCPFIVGIRTYFDLPIWFPDLFLGSHVVPSCDQLGTLPRQVAWIVCHLQEPAFFGIQQVQQLQKFAMTWFRRWKLRRDNLQETMVIGQKRGVPPDLFIKPHCTISTLNSLGSS